MNPWTVVVLVFGIALIIVGIKGSQENLVAALTGKPYGNSALK